MRTTATTKPPMGQRGMGMDVEQRLNAEFDAWFEELQKLSGEKLDKADWVERWYDGYSPKEALEDGPEDDEE